MGSGGEEKIHVSRAESEAVTALVDIVGTGFTGMADELRDLGNRGALAEKKESQELGIQLEVTLYAASIPHEHALIAQNTHPSDRMFWSKRPSAPKPEKGPIPISHTIGFYWNALGNATVLSFGVSDTELLLTGRSNIEGATQSVTQLYLYTSPKEAGSKLRLRITRADGGKLVFPLQDFDLERPKLANVAMFANRMRSQFMSIREFLDTADTPESPSRFAVNKAAIALRTELVSRTSGYHDLLVPQNAEGIHIAVGPDPNTVTIGDTLYSNAFPDTTAVLPLSVTAAEPLSQAEEFRVHMPGLTSVSRLVEPVDIITNGTGTTVKVYRTQAPEFDREIMPDRLMPSTEKWLATLLDEVTQGVSYAMPATLVGSSITAH